MEEEIKEVTEEEVTENTEAQTVEEIEEGIELTDTAEAEETTEETEEDSKPAGRYVTDEELNELIDKRVRRKMNKLEREYEDKFADYRDTEAILNVGLGTTNIQEANSIMREQYRNQGLNVPEPIKPGLSQHQLEVLAKDEANSFIEDGYDAMVEEANRLATKKYVNLSDSEKIVFNTLCERINEEDTKTELLKLGADEAMLKDEKFNSFRKQFNSDVPVKDIYNLYKRQEPKPKFETPGSMKNSKGNSNIKEFYTRDEALKFSRKDLDNNPNLVKAIEKSMEKW